MLADSDTYWQRAKQVFIFYSRAADPKRLPLVLRVLKANPGSGGQTNIKKFYWWSIVIHASNIVLHHHFKKHTFYMRIQCKISK